MDFESNNAKFLFCKYQYMLDFLFLVTVFLSMIFVVVGVAFLTLLERNVLGYVHIHKGPIKVGFVGIFQPFRDAIKLFTREQLFSFSL